MTATDLSTWADIWLAEQFDETPACEWDECDQPATHKLTHLPCNWGVLLCTEHAFIVVKWTSFISNIAWLLLARCKGCGARCHRREWQVKPLNPPKNGKP